MPGETDKHSALRATDPEIHELIRLETKRQDEFIRLIPSENYASAAVMEATGSILNNKYSEGYPGRRYYEGQDYIDRVETLAIERAKALFGMEHANVQPYSGSPANQAVYLALAKPGEPVMGLGLPFGGHLTHGWGVNFSGIVLSLVAIRRRSGDASRRLEPRRVARARDESLRSSSAAARRIRGFGITRAFAQIAKSVGATLVADIAHIAGLIVAGAHPHPYPHAKIVTTTTHKTLRGPRGGMILCDAAHAKDDRSRSVPGPAGRAAQPHDGRDRGRAEGSRDGRLPCVRPPGRRERESAGRGAAERGFRLISGGTDNHLILIDVTPRGITGKPAAKALHEAGIECNYNTIPFDPRKPFDPSGLRIGTPSITSRGMREKDMAAVAAWIDRVFTVADDERALHAIRAEVAEFCKAFPAPGIRV